MRKSVLMFETVVAGASVVLWGIMLAMSLGITYPNSAQFLTGGRVLPLPPQSAADHLKSALGVR